MDKPYKYTIDRAQLGRIIFNNAQERLWLENLIHPIITEKLIEGIDRNANKAILILAIPLLFEANLTHLSNENWLVYCKYEQQIKRLIKRNVLSAEKQLKDLKVSILLLLCV